MNAMVRNTNELISGLVDDLKPAVPLRFSRGVAVAVAALVLTIGLATLGLGVRPDVASGHPHGMFILAGGIFLLLGIASMAATVAMSSPRVGSGRNGWGWAAATPCGRWRGGPWSSAARPFSDATSSMICMTIRF